MTLRRRHLPLLPQQRRLPPLPPRQPTARAPPSLPTSPPSPCAAVGFRPAWGRVAGVSVLHVAANRLITSLPRIPLRALRWPLAPWLAFRCSLPPLPWFVAGEIFELENDEHVFVDLSSSSSC